MDDTADKLSERLQREEKFKDEDRLTSEGIALWYSLKLSYNLYWDEDLLTLPSFVDQAQGYTQIGMYGRNKTGVFPVPR